MILRLLLKVAASVILLFAVVLRVDLASAVASVARGDPALILLATALSFAAWLLNSYKWKLLLQGHGRIVPYRELARLSFVGNFYNFLIPGQVGGEVVKGVRLTHLGVSGSAAAVSIAADRSTGLLALLVLGVAGAAVSSALRGLMGLAPLAALLALFLAGTSFVLVTGRGLGSLPRIALRFLPANEFAFGLTELVGHVRSKGAPYSSLGVALLLSAVFQFMVCSVSLILSLALGSPIAFSELLWVVAVASVLQSLPISVAGLGVREGAYVFLLEQNGVDASTALTLSLLVFATQLSLAAVGGLLQLQDVLRTGRESGTPNSEAVSR